MSERKHQSRPPWPWEALALVAHYIDPKTLAIASCVSKSWSLAMSLDLVWQPFCCSHYPSLSNLKISNPSVPYRRLYAIGLAASKRRLKPPPKPRLSLDDVVFAIELSSKSGGAVPVIAVAEPGSNFNSIERNDLFKFDIGMNFQDCFNGGTIMKALEEIKVTWNVVLKGWDAVFTVMEKEGKLSGICTEAEGVVVEGWFWEELPAAAAGSGCCCGIVGDLKVGFCGGDIKVSVGMLRCVDWRYLSIDDGLRYLQHFLLP